MKAEIDSKKAEIAEIAEIADKYGLDLLILFGSQATGRIHPKSDVDIVFAGKKKVELPQLMTDLDAVFKRDDVQAVDLGTASPTLMHAVVRDGVPLYERAGGAFFKWKLYAIRTWRETSWLRDLRDRKLVDWAKAA